MEAIWTILLAVTGLVGLVCLIMVWVKTFQHGQTGLGIVLILLTFPCGIGYFITLIYGWVKSKEWNLTNIMLIWTICLALNIVANVMHPDPFGLKAMLQGPPAGQTP